MRKHRFLAVSRQWFHIIVCPFTLAILHLIWVYQPIRFSVIGTRVHLLMAIALSDVAADDQTAPSSEEWHKEVNLVPAIWRQSVYICILGAASIARFHNVSAGIWLRHKNNKIKKEMIRISIGRGMVPMKTYIHFLTPVQLMGSKW